MRVHEDERGAVPVLTLVGWLKALGALAVRHRREGSTDELWRVATCTQCVREECDIAEIGVVARAVANEPDEFCLEEGSFHGLRVCGVPWKVQVAVESLAVHRKIEDAVGGKSCAFVDVEIQKVDAVAGHLMGEADPAVGGGKRLEEGLQVFHTAVPEADDVIDVAVPAEELALLLMERDVVLGVLHPCHVQVGPGGGELCTHGHAYTLAVLAGCAVWGVTGREVVVLQDEFDERLEKVRDAVGVEVRFPPWEMVGGASGDGAFKPVSDRCTAVIQGDAGVERFDIGGEEDDVGWERGGLQDVDQLRCVLEDTIGNVLNHWL